MTQYNCPFILCCIFLLHLEEPVHVIIFHVNGVWFWDEKNHLNWIFIESSRMLSSSVCCKFVGWQEHKFDVICKFGSFYIMRTHNTEEDTSHKSCQRDFAKFNIFQRMPLTTGRWGFLLLLKEHMRSPPVEPPQFFDQM